MSEKLTFKPVQKKFIPVEARVVIQVLQTPQETAGKIILPQGSKFLPCLCHVVAVGPDAKWVKEGDQVLVPTSVMTAEVRWNGDETVVVDEMGVWGILDEKILTAVTD